MNRILLLVCFIIVGLLFAFHDATAGVIFVSPTVASQPASPYLAAWRVAWTGMLLVFFAWIGLSDAETQTVSRVTAVLFVVMTVSALATCAFELRAEHATIKPPAAPASAVTRSFNGAVVQHP